MMELIEENKLMREALDQIARYQADGPFHARRTLAAIGPAAQPEHRDDAAIDSFAVALKAKMADSRAKGRNGWDDPALCPDGVLPQMLCEHVAKGDPRDVGVLAMMCWARNESTAAQPEGEAAPSVDIPFELRELLSQHADERNQGMAGPAMNAIYAWHRAGVAEYHCERAEKDEGALRLSVADRHNLADEVKKLRKELSKGKPKARDALGASGAQNAFDAVERAEKAEAERDELARDQKKAVRAIDVAAEFTPELRKHMPLSPASAIELLAYLLAQSAPQARGESISIQFSREQWGLIFDGVMLEISRSEGRKAANSESNSDLRSVEGKSILEAIRLAATYQPAPQAGDAPVATVNDRYSRDGYNDEIDMLLPVGTKLYAAPPASQDHHCKWPTCLPEAEQAKLADEVMRSMAGESAPPASAAPIGEVAYVSEKRRMAEVVIYPGAVLVDGQELFAGPASAAQQD